MRSAASAVRRPVALACVKLKPAVQVRSHAQKYFLRLEKEGRAKEVPQPRPKKRASHPYPVQARSAYAYAAQPPAKARKLQRGGHARALCSIMMRLASGHTFPESVCSPEIAMAVLRLPIPSRAHRCAGQTISGTDSADQAAGAHSASSVDQAAASVSLQAYQHSAADRRQPVSLSRVKDLPGDKTPNTAGVDARLNMQVTAGALSAAASQAEADANFSKLYAIVGSMFDSSVSLPEQLSTIEHLPAEQR